MNRYIVTYKDNNNFIDITQQIKILGGIIIERYNIIPSFVVDFPNEFELSDLQKLDFIEDIELDIEMHTYDNKK